MSTEITKFLDGVSGVVEATNFEYDSLYGRNEAVSCYPWEENPGGYLPTVGYVSGKPVCISLRTAVVRGVKLLFIHPTSEVVDHKMIDKWLRRNLPKTAFREDGYINRRDAANFHNIFPSILSKAA